MCYKSYKENMVSKQTFREHKNGERIIWNLLKAVWLLLAIKWFHKELQRSSLFSSILQFRRENIARL